MNTEALFLFLILLLGLALCSFLGGRREGFSGTFSGTIDVNDDTTHASSGASTASRNRYDHYNHYTGSSTQLSPGATFYGQHGKTATVVSNSDGSQSLQIVLPNSTTPVTFTEPASSVESYVNFGATATTYQGPNGATATVVNADNGQQAVKVTTSNGTYYYNTSGTTSTQYYGSTGSVTGPQGNTAYYAQGPAGNAVVGTTATTATTTTNNDYASAGTVTGPQGNTAYYAQGPAGNTVAGTTASASYYDTLPAGIPRTQIPYGQEDLYILKSQVVPPVCPACPASTVPRQEPCPACPACARCPEPSFECKKVPNYNAINNDYLPAPVLSDFSQFGM